MADDPPPEPAGQVDAGKAVADHGSHDDLVTIVVSFRERWRFTARAIAGIIQNTTGPYKILLLDSGMPQSIRD